MDSSHTIAVRLTRMEFLTPTATLVPTTEAADTVVVATLKTVPDPIIILPPEATPTSSNAGLRTVQ